MLAARAEGVGSCLTALLQFFHPAETFEILEVPSDQGWILSGTVSFGYPTGIVGRGGPPPGARGLVPQRLGRRRRLRHPRAALDRPDGLRRAIDRRPFALTAATVRASPRRWDEGAVCAPTVTLGAVASTTRLDRCASYTAARRKQQPERHDRVHRASAIPPVLGRRRPVGGAW